MLFRSSLVNTLYAMGFDVKHGDTTGLIVKSAIPVAIGALMMLVYLMARKKNAGSVQA